MADLCLAGLLGRRVGRAAARGLDVAIGDTGKFYDVYSEGDLPAVETGSSTVKDRSLAGA